MLPQKNCDRESNSYHLEIINKKFRWSSSAWHQADLDFVVAEVKSWLKEKRKNNN